MSYPTPNSGGFRHEAVFYSGVDEFNAGSLTFIEEGLARKEPILIATGAAKIARLRSELGADADRVLFADMADLGANPARIIPAWTDFVTRATGRSVRGIGEPIYPERSPAELIECQIHERLLNVAFAGAVGFLLLCPYDVSALDAAVLEEARRSHPFASDGESRWVGLDAARSSFDSPLPEPGGQPAQLVFDYASLGAVRSLVEEEARAASFGLTLTADLVLAVNEVATNSLRFGGGGGVFRSWRDGSAVVCEVQDSGRFQEPLAGRVRPSPHQEGGRGLWLVNQLCDLVQVRTLESGTTVRLHLKQRWA